MNPGELVAHMGAVQAQDYTMSKWAIAVRLDSGTLNSVNDSIQKGEILRTHILRPTWHWVASEDIRWMLELSAQRIRRAFDSYGKNFKVDEKLYTRCNILLEKMLEGNRSMTKQEIGSRLEKAGILPEASLLNLFLVRAETEGIICSGPDRNNKFTYALLEERVPAATKIPKEEALAKLAKKYFKSHSPAGLPDFVWWSGLAVSEAKQAVNLISAELIREKSSTAEEWWIHQSSPGISVREDVLHFLPPYDEYLVGYKDRSSVLSPEHYSKAFNNYGIFYRVIMHNGRIVGNWNKYIKNKGIELQTSFFDPGFVADKQLIEAAGNKYKTFIA